MIKKRIGYYYKKTYYAIMAYLGNKPVLGGVEADEKEAQKTLKVLRRKAWNILRRAKQEYKKEANADNLKNIKEIKNYIKTIKIVGYRDYEKAVIKYTQKTPVYETDLTWFDFIESQGEPEDVTIETFEDRFEVLIDSRDYPVYRQALYLHDKKTDKYYMSNKLHMNPRKWGFDFDNENIKAPFKPSCIDYKNPDYERAGIIEPTI